MALRERFLFVGGNAVELREEWMAAYRARYSAALPAGYLDLINAFGPGTFLGFLHLLPPHRLATFGDRLCSLSVAGGVGDPAPWWARKMVFAQTDNDDVLAWDVGGGDAVEILREGEEEFEAFAETFEGFIRACADGALTGERVSHPWFMPARGSQHVRFRFLGDMFPEAAAMEAWCQRQVRLLGAVLLHRAEFLQSGQEPWRTCVLYIPRADAVVHVQAVGGRRCWWSVRASGAIGFPEPDVRALVVSGGDLGWTESAVEAFDAAERDARDWGY